MGLFDYGEEKRKIVHCSSFLGDLDREARIMHVCYFH